MSADLRTESDGNTRTVFRVLTPFMYDTYLSAGGKFLTSSVDASYDPLEGILGGMEVFPSREVLDAVLHDGWLGEHFGLRAALVFAGVTVLGIAALAWRQPVLRGMRTLPAINA